jgi:AraC-like DNA-binding protein
MIFDWSNFEQHTQSLLGNGIEPEWIIESPSGRALNYQFDQAAGSGRMEFFEFASDIRTIVFDCHWKQTQSFRVRDGDWVRFNFSLSIDIAMKLSDTITVNAVSPSWRIINNVPGTEAIEKIPAGTNAVWVTVCCKPNYITELTGQAIENMPDLLRAAVFNDTHDSFHELFEFTSRLNTITADIIKNDLSGSLRISYVEARSIELLCLALNEIMYSQRLEGQLRLTRAEENALGQARKVLLQQYRNPPTVAELSRQAGINRNKLFYGFKNLYSMTISEFIQEQRLEEGKRLLQQTDLSVLEIANRVGFKHQCNFSTAMKRVFDMTPSQLRE